MKTIKNKIQKHIRHRGAVLVETAIVIVLLLMLTLGTIGFGYLFVQAQHITYLARHGARVGSRYGADSATVTAALAPYMRTNETIIECTVGSNKDAPVTVKVAGTNLDILHMPGIVPIPNDFNATVTMAKEGP